MISKKLNVFLKNTTSSSSTIIKTGIMAIACGAILMPAGATTVYKSIGKFGEVKYSQFQPTDTSKYEVIELRNGRQMNPGDMAGRTNADMAPTPTAEDQEMAKLKNQVEQQNQTIEEQKRNQLAAKCADLRNSLANLNTGGRLYEPDGKGGRKYLDDREIELKRENIQNLISTHCSGVTT